MRVFIIMVLLSAAVFGQNVIAQNIAFEKSNFKDRLTGFKVALKHKNQGDLYLFQHDYKKALTEFLAANEFNPNSVEVNCKIGESYLHTTHKEIALKHLSVALKLDSKMDSYYIMLLGKSYHMMNQFEDAIKYYQRAKSTPSKVKNDVPEIAQRHIEECNNGDYLVLHPVNVKVEILSKAINTEHQEYVPVITADHSEMFFTSRRPSNIGGNVDIVIADYFEDIYHSVKKDDKWGESTNLGMPINSERHDATVGLSFDGHKLFLYRDDSKGIGNIYVSERDGLTWKEPVKLSAPINSKNTETSACFDHTGNTIYFVSDRKGGLGGKDIYVSSLSKEGKWAVAVNLGAVVNTMYDEDAVFMHADGKTLYFSSKGHNSMGGYDIFKTTLDKGIWTKPVNIGFPVNSPDDDVCFVLSADGESGYFTSDKVHGEGLRDIYKITFNDVINEHNRPKLTLVKGVITDEETGKPLKATIEVYDNDLGELIGTFESNSATGKYMLSLPSGHHYGINVESKGYLFYSESIDLPETKLFEEVTDNIGLDRLKVGNKVVLNNIFYDYGKATVSTESHNELDKVVKLLNGNPDLKLEMSAHTDSRGGDSFNQKLSQERAQSVVDFLKSKGIAKNRLVAMGYGEKMLVVSDKEIEKIIDEAGQEKLHQKNRRTEFKIIE
jgi:outer membrane protein OmpA-like peptidoglycan-associated protein/tetratricopeptide (TPR) repeat protein